jgi:UPF0176 protein
VKKIVKFFNYSFLFFEEIFLFEFLIFDFARAFKKSVTEIHFGGSEMPINTSGYEFQSLDNEKIEIICKSLEELRDKWKEMLVGKVIVTPEGINIAASGDDLAIRDLQKCIQLLGFNKVLFKDMPCLDNEKFDHRRFLIKQKDEVITLRAGSVDMALTAEYKSPDDLAKELDSNSNDIVMLDIRNTYEYQVGHFNGAELFPTDKFSEFADSDALIEFMNKFSGKKVVTYCTGGVRCEKATAWIRGMGYKGPLWQLEGGILSYGERVGDRHWNGECFVFDKRGGVLLDKEAEQKRGEEIRCKICEVRGCRVHSQKSNE